MNYMVLVPAVLSEQIAGNNIERLHFRILSEATNGATTLGADAI